MSLRAQVLGTLLLAALTVLVPLALLPVRPALFAAFLGVLMLAIAISDAERFVVPDVLSLPAIPLGLLASGSLADRAAPLVDPMHVAAAAVGAAALWLLRLGYRKLRGREGLGLGDVKLAAVTGSWTGLDGLAVTLLLAALSALVVTLVRARLEGTPVTATLRVPFAVYLAPATWLTFMGSRVLAGS